MAKEKAVHFISPLTTPSANGLSSMGTYTQIDNPKIALPNTMDTTTASATPIKPTNASIMDS